MTKASQETYVGEGLALGCVALEVEQFSGSKMAVEFAFVKAWRIWPYASSFPAVHANIQRNDLLHIIRKSPRRVSSHLTGWESEWPFVPYIYDEWTVGEVGGLLESSSGVPLEGWISLAQVFLDDLNR